MKRWTPYVLIAPAMVVLFSIWAYPSIMNFYYSFWEMNYGQLNSFIGLKNYLNLLADARFWNALGNTFIFVFACVVLELILGLIVALILSKYSVRARQILGSVIFLPYMVAQSVAGIIWRLLWNYDYGLINYIIGFLGIAPQLWLSDPVLAKVAVIVTEVWRNVPFMIMVLLAGIISMPSEPFEAAKVDGASPFQIFKNLTIPLLAPSILTGLLFRTVFAIRIFDTVFTLTKGGPGEATTPLGLLIYQNNFGYFRNGYASAIAIVMLITGLIFSIFYLKSLGKEAEL